MHKKFIDFFKLIFNVSFKFELYLTWLNAVIIIVQNDPSRSVEAKKICSIFKLTVRTYIELKQVEFIAFFPRFTSSDFLSYQNTVPLTT